jgi:hypothetical protein
MKIENMTINKQLNINGSSVSIWQQLKSNGLKA